MGDIGFVPPPSDDKKLLDELVFKQDLNEVHLLMDFASGRADRSLSNLTMPNPTKPRDKMTSGEIVQAITKMRYPPQGGDAVNAVNAAILLMAKDRLSALVAPARGLTIAYTAMFIDAEAGGSPWSRIRDALRWPRKSASASTHTPGTHTAIDQTPKTPTRRPSHDTRIDLAVRTFPGLQAHARLFRAWRDVLAWFTVFWLFLTGVAYWDAGLGRSVLERLDQDWKGYAAQLADNPSLVRCTAATATDAAKISQDAKSSDESDRMLLACGRHVYLELMENSAIDEVRRVFRCEGMFFMRPLHVWCWHWLLTGGTGEALGPKTVAQNQSPADAQNKPDLYVFLQENATYWQTATSILTVFTTYVLPMMFGLLGTLIGAFRAILNRIRDSELGPRDLVRMKIGIPTGLVAGIAVGLFLSPSSAPVQGTGGVANDLTLTASGLGFLAGYASQSFFRFLDNMLGTVFPDGSAAAAPTSRTAREQRS